MLTIHHAVSPDDVQDAATLLSHYADTRKNDPAYSLVCADVANLPGAYAPPQGGLLLARKCGDPVACVAYRHSAPDICEMKRLYVAPEQRGANLGRRLCHAVIRSARREGYMRMRLDSVPGMAAARHLYAAMNFEQVAPYWENPNADTLYYEIDLTRWCACDEQYSAYLDLVNESLGISNDHIAGQALPRVHESCDLVDAGPDMFNRPQRLTLDATQHWFAMRDGAREDGLSLQLVSAFRSVEYQASLIADKCDAGRSLEEVLSVNAAPGYSEHHSGAAVDISTAGSDPLAEDFEQTHAFRWLSTNASRFGFSLSYERDNPHALVYEPWHWCWAEK